MNILGTTTVTVEQARAWARARGGHQRFIDVIPIYYRLAPLYGVAADVPVGQAAKETDRGHYTGVVGPERHNWCGLKTAAGGSNSDPDAHATFASDEEGVEAHLQHLWRYAGGTREQLPAGRRLLDPRFDAVTRFTQEVEGLGGPGSWAPSPTYGRETAAIVADLRAFAASAPPGPQPGRVVRVALAAGHHNTSGGNGLEIEQTGRLTPAIAAACRALGMDVRVVTPDEGRGTFDGSLSAVAGRVVEWHNAGWPADLFLEVHTEGNSAGDRGRGAFAIYPDWPSSSDLDVDVRDTLGPDLVSRLTAATGLPARGSGVMSERSTGVGSEGDRLGVFRATVGIRATCTRLIVEYGSHTSPADLRLWSQPGFVDAAARATAEAIAAFYGSGQQPQPTPAPPPTRPAWVTDPDARYWPETEQWTQWAFNGRVNELAGLVLLALGYPIGPEARAIVDGVERTVQPFERGWLGYYPEDTPPWHVRHLTVDEVMAILDPAA